MGMFNFLKNPFERLTAENQEGLKKSTDSVAESLTDRGPIFLKLDAIDKKLETISTVLGDISKKLNVKGKVKADAKEMKQMGETAKAMGQGMQWFVDAIESFAKIDDSTVEKFVVAIERIGEAFKKMEKTAAVIEKASKILSNMALGIILFGLALIVALPIYILAIPGAIIAIAVISGFVYIFSKVLGDKENAEKIQTGAEALAMMGIAVILFGVAMLLVGVGVYSKLIGVATVAIFGVLLGFILLFAYVLGKVLKDNIKEGVEALAMMGISVILFGVAIFLVSKIYEYLDPRNAAGGMAAILLVMGAMVGIFFLLSKAGDNILDGAKAMFIMAGTILLLGIAIWAFTELVTMNQKTWESMFMAGVALSGLALIMQLVPEKDVVKGALAMLISTATIAALAGALYLWQEAGITLGTTLLAGMAISGLAITMAIAGEMKSEILKGSLVMILATVPLFALGYALKTFKESGITLPDLGIVAAAVTGLGTLMAAAGFGPIPMFIALGAGAMVIAGAAVVLMAEGLAEFKKIDFDVAQAKSFATAIGTVIGTFSGISFKDSLMMQHGVSALSGVGNIMTSLAGGIQSFADMKFVEYEFVKDSKTGMTKIQPKSIVELSDAKIEAAGVNFGKVINAIVMPITEVGIMDSMGTGLFSGGYFTKGVAALTGVGGIMTSMAGGIQSLANLTFTRWDIFTDKKTGEKKIQPAEILKLTEGDFTAAGQGFAQIVGAMVNPISEVGKASKDGSGWFSGGNFESGVKALTGVGDIMTTMAKGISDFANLTFTSYRVEKGKLVPVAVVKITPAMINSAAANFTLVANSMIRGIVFAGKQIEANKDSLEYMLDNQENILKIVNGFSEFAGDWSKVANPLILGTSFETFVKSVTSVFDPKKNPTNNLVYFNMFADKMAIFGKSSSEFESIANSFEKIGKSMGEFKTNLNGLDKDILTETRGLFDAMAVIAKVDGGDKFLKKYSDSLKTTFDKLHSLLEEFKGSVDNNTVAQKQAVKAAVPVQPPAPGLKAQPNQPQIVDMTGVISAINQLKLVLTSQGIKVKNDTLG